MSKAYMGAVVRYCGHEGTFIADIRLVAGANVINANGPVTGESLNRDPADYALATHQLDDFPEAGGWFPRRGFFVVPEKQVTQISGEQRKVLVQTKKKVNAQYAARGGRNA